MTGNAFISRFITADPANVSHEIVTQGRGYLVRVYRRGRRTAPRAAFWALALEHLYPLGAVEIIRCVYFLGWRIPVQRVYLVRTGKDTWEKQREWLPSQVNL